MLNLALFLTVAFAAETSPLNPGAVDIQTPQVYRAIYAMSDVHGMIGPTRALLKAAGLTNSEGSWMGGSSLLIVVGDSIDKGPNSLDVLDQWILLSVQAKAQGGRVLHLLGNHEAEFLANPQSSAKSAALLDELARRHLPLTDLTSDSSPRGAFLLSEPLAARVGRWLFCHAGKFPDLSWGDFLARAKYATGSPRRYGDELLAGDNSLLEAKKWWSREKDLREFRQHLDGAGFAGVVFGHQPKAFGAEGRIAAVEGGRFVKIDVGMAPDAGGHAGALLKFPNPIELAQSGIPQMQVILPSGTTSELLAESLMTPLHDDAAEVP